MSDQVGTKVGDDAPPVLLGIFIFQIWIELVRFSGCLQLLGGVIRCRLAHQSNLPAHAAPGKVPLQHAGQVVCSPWKRGGFSVFESGGDLKMDMDMDTVYCDLIYDDILYEN